MQEAFQTHIGYAVTTSSWRHIAIAIAKRHLDKSTLLHWAPLLKSHEQEQRVLGDLSGLIDRDNDDDLEAAAFDEDNILIRQASHGGLVACLRYAVDNDFLRQLGPDSLSAFESASVCWHALLVDGRATLDTPDTAIEGNTEELIEVSASTHTPSNIYGCSAQKQHWTRDHSDPLELLQSVEGETATWKSSAQETAFIHILGRMPVSVIVLGTGTGKTSLILAIAKRCTTDMVVVIVPFISLLDDIHRRADLAGIQCRLWSTGMSRLPDSTQLLLVSADMASSAGFLAYAKILTNGGEIRLLVFDECHTVLTDAAFRGRLAELQTIRQLNAPLLLLTATLPPSMEGNLNKAFALQSAPILRFPTQRPSIHYSVVKVEQQHIHSRAMETINKIELAAGTKGIIYVRAIAAGQRLAMQLGTETMALPQYNSSLTLAETQQSKSVWDAEGGWLVATGALGTGIDIPGVEYVVHVGRPYGLISFAQQSGRGGRNGNKSTSILIVDPSSGNKARPFITSASSVKAQDEAALDVFIQSDYRCRQEMLSTFLDGINPGNDCLTQEIEQCDHCIARHTVQPVPRHIIGSEPPAQSTNSAQSTKLITPVSMAHKRSYTGRQIEPSPKLPRLDMPNPSLYTRPIETQTPSFTGHDSSSATLSTPCRQGPKFLNDTAFSRHVSDPIEATPSHSSSADVTPSRSSSGYATVAEMNRKHGEETAQGRKILSKLHGQCLYCLLTSEKLEEHDWTVCPSILSTPALNKDLYRDWRRTLNFPDYFLCFTCAAPRQRPQEWCTFVRGMPCPYGDILRPMLWLLARLNRLNGSARVAGWSGGSETELWKWTLESDVVAGCSKPELRWSKLVRVVLFSGVVNVPPE